MNRAKKGRPERERSLPSIPVDFTQAAYTVATTARSTAISFNVMASVVPETSAVLDRLFEYSLRHLFESLLMEISKKGDFKREKRFDELRSMGKSLGEINGILAQEGFVESSGEGVMPYEGGHMQTFRRGASGRQHVRGMVNELQR